MRIVVLWCAVLGVGGLLGGCVGGPAGADPSLPPKAVNPYKAYQWRRLAWLDENGHIAPGALARALEQRRANVEHWEGQDVAGISPQSWIERGPRNVGGRSRSLVINPADPQEMWGGSVSGGIWHTTSGGASWAPVNDWHPSLAICCLTRDPHNPGVMYAGTGEGFFNGDAIGGVGIYKSIDGGATWDHLPSTAGMGNICRIAISPTNSNILLVSSVYGGIHRSTDAGATWTHVYGAQGSFDVDFHPQFGNRAIAQVLDYDFGAGDWFHRVVYSTDGGQTWAASAGLSKQFGFFSRIEVAFAPSKPTTIYASNAGDGKIWRSTDQGLSFSPVTTGGATGASWYANPLWVDPTNPDILLSGGYHVVRSTDGGVTLEQVSNGYIMTAQTHPDIHNFTHDPGYNGTTNRRVYVQTDGGIYIAEDILAASTSGGWSNLDREYRTTQFYGAAGHGPTGLIVGGTQDNGTLRLTGAGDDAHLTFGGDGGFCAIDPQDPKYVYGEYITLQVHRSVNGGASATWMTTGLGDAGTAANFIAPLVNDPGSPGTLYGGGRSLWRTTNARGFSPTWKGIRGPGTDNISAIAVAPGVSMHVWIGQNNAEVHRTKEALLASPAWQAVDDNGGKNPLPNRYITRIAISPADPETAYIALGGWSPDNIWKTTDAGLTWQDVTGDGPTGLPHAPVRGFAVHPTKPGWLYAGTEVGIFASEDDGANWSATNDGPANASVDELVFMHGSTELLAATHGRGLWTARILDCPADCEGDGDLDVLDFLCFQGRYALGESYADFDGDGDLDIFDFLAFQGAFAAGCG